MTSQRSHRLNHSNPEQVCRGFRSADHGLNTSILSGGPKFGVSNERLSAKVKLRCKLDIQTALLSPPSPPSSSRITVFPGGNIKILNVLKISPRFHAVPLGLRHQGIGSSYTFSVLFHQSGMARAGPKKL